MKSTDQVRAQIEALKTKRDELINQINFVLGQIAALEDVLVEVKSDEQKTE